MTIKRSVKNRLSEHSLIYSIVRRSYHFLNFHRIAKSQIKMYRRQIRLYSYFEVVYSNELEYLREHIRKLEILHSDSSSKSGALTHFPRVPSLKQYSERADQPHENFYVKRFLNKNRWAGLSADQAFFLEVESLNRLNAKREHNKLDHYPFPILIEAIGSKLKIKISHCGWSLDQLKADTERIKVRDSKLQIENMVALLIRSGVMHLDLRPDGKNICVDSDGNLSLIDFDIVVINDERPLSWQIKRRRDIARKFPDGYYLWAVNKIDRALQKHSDKLELL